MRQRITDDDDSRPFHSTAEPRGVEPLRYARKFFDGRGLYLLVMPNGGQYWRYNYRCDGKLKMLVFPSAGAESL